MSREDIVLNEDLESLDESLDDDGDDGDDGEYFYDEPESDFRLQEAIYIQNIQDQYERRYKL